MRTYDRQAGTDTFLSGGLIAIGLVWLGFSAVQVSPAFTHDDAPARYAAAAAAPSALGTAALAAHPAANLRAGADKAG